MPIDPMARKGKPRPAGAGRAAGTPNKATQDARRAIAEFVDGNAHRLTGWLDQIAQEDPAKAFDLFQKVIEYHVPKLARQEITGKDGEAIEIKGVRWLRPGETKTKS